MQLKIKKNIDNEIIVYLSKNIELIFSEKKEDLNHEKINDFLIKVASSIPEGEKIEIVSEYNNPNNEDKIFHHIVYLFSEFAKSFNESD